MMAITGRMLYQPYIECEKSTSIDTSPEDPTDYKPNHKEKSQLCKKFIEYGYCPYKIKCKFAHGKHELRHNNQLNSRYKTKQCVAFFKNGSCPYGERCNFLHASQSEKKQHERRRKMRANFIQLFEECRTQSRFFA